MSDSAKILEPVIPGSGEHSVDLPPPARPIHFGDQKLEIKPPEPTEYAIDGLYTPDTPHASILEALAEHCGIQWGAKLRMALAICKHFEDQYWALMDAEIEAKVALALAPKEAEIERLQAEIEALQPKTSEVPPAAPEPGESHE